jgi:hypothetical protein
LCKFFNTILLKLTKKGGAQPVLQKNIQNKTLVLPEALFERKVDLLSDQPIKNIIFNRVGELKAIAKTNHWGRTRLEQLELFLDEWIVTDIHEINIYKFKVRISLKRNRFLEWIQKYLKIAF